MKNKTLLATATLVGTTIGAGMFGIPYAINQIGLLPGLFYLLLIGLLSGLLNLAYGEVILKTKGDHQLTGYSEIYLGKRGKMVAAASLLIGLYGALLAYLIKIGEFLAIILNFQQPVLLSILFFCLSLLVIFLGLKTISKAELLLVGLMLFFIGLIAAAGAHQINLDHFVSVSFHWKNLFLPYGVLLFALAGSTAIPEAEEVLRHQPRHLKKAIIGATLIPFFTYLIFTIAIIGISGPLTSDDAISGLVLFLPKWITLLGAGVGTLAMATSFFTLGYVLREVWLRDFKQPKGRSLALMALPPLLLFLLGARNFIAVLGVTGALTGGLTGILIVCLHNKTKHLDGKRSYHLKIPTFLYWALGVLFLLGMTTPFWS